MPRTVSSFFSILDPTLSSDGVKHPNGGLPYLTPENTASIPSFAEPIPESDPKFSLVPFPPSRRMSPTATESLAFSPPNTTLSGDETKSPTRGSLRCCSDNVTIVELTVLRVWYPSWVPDTLPNKRQVSDLQFTLPSAAAPGVRPNIIPRYTLFLAPK